MGRSRTPSGEPLKLVVHRSIPSLFDPNAPPTVSSECYTLFADGRAELRQRGVLTDTGRYDATSGEIVWSSGGVSNVESDGVGYWVNSTPASVIGDCR